MRTFYTLLGALLLAHIVKSQTVFFEYDEAGNRVRRVRNTSLPVSMTSFSLRTEESSVLLEWETVYEDNTGYFIAERSADGKAWAGIGQVAAAGYSFHLNRYRYTDGEPFDGRNIYRLKVVDNDGSYSYSELKSLFWGAAPGVYPNPVDDFLFIKGVAGVKSVQIFNMEGKLMEKRTALLPGDRFDLRSYHPGIYWVRVTADSGQVKSYKILKK